MMTTADSQAQEQQQASSSTSMLKERRFKLSRACDRCRRRRIKCDEGHPCQACLTANSSCTFEEPGKRTHPHKSKRTATLEDRMHHLETLIQAIPPAVFAAGGAPPGHSATDFAGSPVLPSMYPKGILPGVPPPSLHVFPLTNPSTHFTARDTQSPRNSFSFGNGTTGPFQIPDSNSDGPTRMSLTASYLYFDDEGCTRWQGETSGLPVLDLLVESHIPPAGTDLDPSNSAKVASAANAEWFPNRQPRKVDVNPQTLWRLITSSIAPELMDSLVQCYLSTSYYILPFLHVPTFLADYGNPQKWAEPGFAAFIVAICCLASRHLDDPRVRSDPNDGISAGTHWFDLFSRLQTLPISDRPTLYNIQANLIAAVYAVGLGKLSKAASLLAEAVTMSIDGGLHRSADSYDLFDAIEDELRKRTFWCVYIWDKQLSAHFGRPSVLRLRDCDVPEPAPVDDEYITKDGVGVPPPEAEERMRMSAFVVSLRIMVVLESVLDVPPARSTRADDRDRDLFLSRAASVLSGSGGRGFKEMREEEKLLDDIHRSIPPFWAHQPQTLGEMGGNNNSEDTIRLTQAERLHCAEHFVRLLIYRHRFSELVAERKRSRMTNGEEQRQSEEEQEAMIAAHNSALEIVTAHVLIAKKGLMTYYGVHVIHQLTQAGRTLVAVLLCCNSEALQHLIPPGLDALRSCIGLLRRFSGRYVCGLRSGDLMEEFCRLTNIPLETSSRQDSPANTSRPPWIRPIRKKAPSARSSVQGPPSLALQSQSQNTNQADSSSPSHSQHSSPESFSPSDFLIDHGPGSSGSGGTPQATGSGTSGSAAQSSNGGGGSASGRTQTPPQYHSMPVEVESGPQMFMSAQDMMSLFGVDSLSTAGSGVLGGSGGLGDVDVEMQQLFTPEFLVGGGGGGGSSMGVQPMQIHHSLGQRQQQQRLSQHLPPPNGNRASFGLANPNQNTSQSGCVNMKMGMAGPP